jgi:hypothetical protein
MQQALRGGGTSKTKVDFNLFFKEQIKMTKTTKSEIIVAETSNVDFFPVFLNITAKASFDEWEAVGKKLRACQGSVLWWLGDWVNYGEDKFGEKFAQVISETDYDLETIRQAAWVCSRVPIVRRRVDVPFSTFKMIASLEEAQQVKMLERIVTQKMTQAEVRKILSRDKRQANLANNSVPVLSLDAVRAFDKLMADMLMEMPLEKRDPQELELLKSAFESMVFQTRKAYGWNQ